MRITRLILKNWGPHENLDLDMDTPVFGLLGPNASGKSNIMSAIAFGFTGLLELNQATYVRSSAGEDCANGSVDLYFVKGGIKGRIFRQVGKSPSRKLWWEDWKNPITKAAEIDKLMSQILDCDKKAIDQAVFLAQGHLADFLMGLPSQREADFARMCQVDHLALISDIAGQEMVRLQKTVTDLTSQRDEATLALENAEAALRTSEGELELLPDRTQSLKWLNECLGLLRTFRSREISINTLLGELHAAKERRDTIFRPQFLGQADDAETALLDLQEKLARSSAAAELKAGAMRERETRVTSTNRLNIVQLEVQSILAKAGQLMSVQARQQELTTTLLELTQYKTHLQRYTEWQARKDELDNGIEKGTAYIAALRTEETIASEERAAFDMLAGLESTRIQLKLAQEVGSHVEGCCPLCRGSDLSNLPTGEELTRRVTKLDEETRNAQKAISDLANERRILQSALSRLDAYKEQLAVLEASRPAAVNPHAPALDREPVLLEEQRQLTKTQQELQAEMSMVPRLNAEAQALRVRLDSSQTVEQLDQVIAEQTALSQDLPDLQQKVMTLKSFVVAWQQVNQRCVEAQARMEQAQAETAEASAQYSRIWTVKPKDLKISEAEEEFGLTMAISELTARQAERDRAQGMIRANTDALRRAEFRIGEIEERAKKNAATQSVIGHLEELKNAFGRNGIPRHYLTKVFEALVGLTQENLADWDTDFQIEKDEAQLFNFLFCRTDDPETMLDQSQLSGGQRTRLALSFVQAVQRLLYPGLDFLCVDEPSNHLDAEGVEGLVRLFQTIASQNEGGEAQVIVVDHNPLLTRAFSKSVTLARK